MVFMAVVTSGKRMGSAARAVFFFQEFNRIFTVMPLQEEVVNAEFSSGKTAPPCERRINLVLRDEVLLHGLQIIRQGELQTLRIKVGNLVKQELRGLDILPVEPCCAAFKRLPCLYDFRRHGVPPFMRR